MATFSFGDLIADVDAAERTHQAGMQQHRHELTKYGSLVALHSQVQAELLRWRPDPDRMPGIDRIELLCNQTCGTGVQLTSLFQLRGVLRKICGLTLAAADRLSLDEFADRFEDRACSPPGAADVAKEPRHSKDFTTVHWGGHEPFRFTTRQAACVCVMWQAFGDAHDQHYILENAADVYRKVVGSVHEQTQRELEGLETKRQLRDVFKVKRKGKTVYHDAWKTMIVSLAKGKFKLASPGSSGAR